MIAFLANTPETLGWLFTYITQAPVLFDAIRKECDALPSRDMSEYAGLNWKEVAPHLHSALFETCRHYVFTGTPATVVQPCTLPGMGDHIFQAGDILHSMGEGCAMDERLYGSDARLWKRHRFVKDGEKMLKYDLTFGIGRSPCPGRTFAINELCALAAGMVQAFDFASPLITERIDFSHDDWHVGSATTEGEVEIIDLDEKTKKIAHPGNGSNSRPPGMTAANVPLHEFSCVVAARKK